MNCGRCGNETKTIVKETGVCMSCHLEIKRQDVDFINQTPRSMR